MNDDQKKDIEKSFNDFFKQKFEFIYDDKVVKNDTPEKEEKAKELGVKKVDLDELLRLSDVISLHTPLTEEDKKYNFSRCNQ